MNEKSWNPDFVRGRCSWDCYPRVEGHASACIKADILINAQNLPRELGYKSKVKAPYSPRENEKATQAPAPPPLPLYMPAIACLSCGEKAPFKYGTSALAFGKVMSPDLTGWMRLVFPFRYNESVDPEISNLCSSCGHHVMQHIRYMERHPDARKPVK